jgi:hypothetical protein
MINILSERQREYRQAMVEAEEKLKAAEDTTPYTESTVEEEGLLEEQREVQEEQQVQETLYVGKQIPATILPLCTFKGIHALAGEEVKK